MSAEPFTLDTNILVYSIDRRAGARHETAKAILSRAALARCHLTLQAISEFYAVVTRKGVVPPIEARQIAEAMMDVFPVCAASEAAVRAALGLAASGRAAYWDALLLATAAEAGCTAMLTEDMADGMTLAGVRVINPFAGAGLGAATETLLRAE